MTPLHDNSTNSAQPIRPYPGLRPFRFEESKLFYGRDRQSLRMITTLIRQHFLAVVGTSGCGKSSLVKAGLLPELRHPQTRIGESDLAWAHIIARPGGGPFRNLAVELARQCPKADVRVDPAQIQELLQAGTDGLIDAIYSVPGMASRNVLVVIDQFEEIFRFGDTSQRRISELERTNLHNDALAFVDRLLSAVQARNPQIFVAITMRSDSLGRCDLFDGLPEAITRSQFLPPRMTKEQWLDAICRPLEHFQSTIEDTVVSDLLEAMGDRQDQLPVVQHALAQLWNFASDGKSPKEPRHLTAAHAERCRAQDNREPGGEKRLAWVTDAISTHAEAVYESLALRRPAAETAERQHIAQVMFCALSQMDNKEEPERRLSSIDEVARIAFGQDVTETQLRQTESVAQAFAEEGHNFVFRSTTASGRDALDISHECLLRQWSRLQTWLEDERKSAQQYRRLRDEVENNTKVLTDTHLDQAQEWVAKRNPTSYWAMRYDGVSEPADSWLDRCLPLIKSSHEARRLRLEKEQADLQREQDRLHEAEATAVRFQRITATAVVACVVAVVCLVLALTSLKNTKRAEDTAQKLQANANRQNASHYWRFGAQARDAKEADPLKASHLFLRGAASLALIPPAKATPADKTAIATHGLAAANVDRSLVRSWVHDASVRGAQFSQDESRVLTWSDDQTARLWDVTKTEPIEIFKHDANVNGAQFSRDELRVLTWSDDRTARLWDVTKTEPIQTFQHDGFVIGAQFSRNKSRVLTWSDDQTARLWDVTKTEPIEIFKHDANVNGAQFSRDELRVLTWSDDDTARLWDVTKTEPIEIFKHDANVNGAQFSRDESRVLTWSDDDTTRLWDVSKPEPIQTFKDNGGVRGAQFSRDESRVLTWSDDRTARLWNVTKAEPIQTFQHDGFVIGAQFSRDELHVLTWSDDDTARLWDVTKTEPIEIFKHDANVNGAQFSRDESRVLTWSDDDTTRLWDVGKPEPIQTFKDNGGVRGAQFSRDESRVLTWSDDRTARLWNVTKAEPIQTFQHDGFVNGAQFSRNESRVLTWSDDQTARLWDVTKAEPIQTFQHNDSVYGAQFNRDETRVLTWSSDSRVRLWDVTKAEPIQTFQHNDTVYGAQFNRDETLFLTWSGDYTARLWDVTKAEAIHTFKHDHSVDGAQFSRNESRVLTWSEDDTARLWDVTEAEAIHTFKHDHSVDGAQFSRDESRVLTWSYDKTARLWDVTKAEPLQTFKHDGLLYGAQFSRDESRVLTWSGDFSFKRGEARLWDVAKTEPIQTFKHNGGISGARFSRNESRVLTWSDDGTARLWEVTKTEPIQTFQHDGWVRGAQFSRDELRVLTWSFDNTGRLWDVTKAEPIQTFQHDGWVRGAQFSREESRVLTWSNDNTVRLWDVPDPFATLTPVERILELEVRSGATLDKQQKLRTLKFEEWQAKVKSVAYQAIQKKLATPKSNSSP